jgi:hypothetical protein
MYLRALDIWADESIVDRFAGGFCHRFHRETCCIADLVSKLLWKQVITEDTPKLVFVFTDRRACPDARTLTGDTCKWPFDFAKYVDSDTLGKKRQIIDTLYEALLWIAAQRRWPCEPFDEAYRSACKRNLVYDGFGKKSWVSPDGRYRVRVFFRYELEGVELYAVLYRNRSVTELCRRQLGRGVPDIGCLWNYLDEGKWRSETVFQLRSKGIRGEVWTADFSSAVIDLRGPEKGSAAHF